MGDRQSFLGDLPQGCLAHILGRTRSPRDVVRLALVNKSFLEASLSDVVWEQMLPPHWQEVIASAADRVSWMRSRGARFVFQQLTQGVLVGDSQRQRIYSVDRATGGICYMLSARSLSIWWAHDGRYWDWHPLQGSRFEEVAHLKSVCWFEIHGHLQCYLWPGKYILSFRLQLERNEGAYGWGVNPAEFLVTTKCCQGFKSMCYLGRSSNDSLENVTPTRNVEHGWIEYDIAEIVVGKDNSNVEVQIIMKVEGGNWKGGLYVDGVVLRPSYLVSRSSAATDDQGRRTSLITEK